MRLPILQLSCRLFWQSITSPRSVSSPCSPDLAPCDFWLFPKAKITVEVEKICECDGHTEYKPSQRRLTANWLAPQESDCSQMDSKVFSNWLRSYIKAMRMVLEILKMARYFSDSPCIPIQHHMSLKLEEKLHIGTLMKQENRIHCFTSMNSVNGSDPPTSSIINTCGHRYKPNCMNYRRSGHTQHTVNIQKRLGYQIIWKHQLHYSKQR